MNIVHQLNIQCKIHVDDEHKPEVKRLYIDNVLTLLASFLETMSV